MAKRRSTALTPPTRFQPGEGTPQRYDKVYREFVEVIGGKEGLAEIAAYSDDPKVERLLDLMNDPTYSNWGVKKLAQMAGLTFTQLVGLRNKRSMALAVSNLLTHLPTIAEGAAIDASPRMEICGECYGDKFIVIGERPTPDGPVEITKKCSKCRGTGEIRISGDKDARNWVGKATKIIEDGGVTVQTNIQVNSNPQGSFEDLMKKASAVTVTARKVEDVDHESV